MTEHRGEKRKQPSSCPEGWWPAASVVQLEQERYAQRCVGIARFVYNRIGGQRPGRQGRRPLAHAS